MYFPCTPGHLSMNQKINTQTKSQEDDFGQYLIKLNCPPPPQKKPVSAQFLKTMKEDYSKVFQHSKVIVLFDVFFHSSIYINTKKNTLKWLKKQGENCNIKGNCVKFCINARITVVPARDRTMEHEIFLPIFSHY